MNQGLQKISVAIVEDEVQEREALAALLRSSPDIECVDCCRSAADALKKLPLTAPDVVLMDIQMTRESGVDCVRRLKPLLPSSQFMMLTVVEDHDTIFHSLAAGATGYLLKKTAPGKLLEAIRELHAGGAPMSGQIARHVIAAFHERTPVPGEAANLSPVEQNVLKGLARGLLYKEVADELQIAISTVRTHVWRIYRKLHAHNRTEAILKGLPRPAHR